MLDADIILVRGAPGVGKSTLSARLKALFSFGATIEVGPFLKMIHAFEDGNSQQYSDSLDLICRLALLYLERGYHPVFIVGPLKSPRVQNFFEKVPAEIGFKVITLCATNNDIDIR